MFAKPYLMKKIALLTFTFICLSFPFARAQSTTAQSPHISDGQHEAWSLFPNQSIKLCSENITVGELNSRIRTLLRCENGLIADVKRDSSGCWLRFKMTAGVNKDSLVCTIMEIKKPQFIIAANDSLSNLIFFQCKIGKGVMTAAIAPNSSVLIVGEQLKDRYYDLVDNYVITADSRDKLHTYFLNRFINEIANEIVCSDRVFKVYAAK